MKKLFLKTAIILCLTVTVSSNLTKAAQPTWTRMDSTASSPVGAAYDSNGNAYYITSSKPSPTAPSYDIKVIKYSKTGVLLGSVYYDYHSGNDYPTKIKIDSSNNIYVIGAGLSNIGPALHYDAVLLKYNSSLVLQWARNQNSNGNGDDVAVDFDIDKYGTIYVLCSFTKTPTDRDMGFVSIKTDGTNQHANIFSGDSVGTDQIAKRLKVGKNGTTVYVCGANKNSTYGYDGIIMTINGSLGVAQRADFHNAGNNSYDCFNDFALDSNANLHVWGEYNYTPNPGNTITRPFIVSYNFQLTYRWNNALALNVTENAIKIFVDGAQNPIGITGTGRFVKFNGTTGSIVKNKPVVGKILEIKDAGITGAGQVYMCGFQVLYKVGGGDSVPAYLSKISNSGNLVWESKWMAPSNTISESNTYRGLAISGTRVYVIGAHYPVGSSQILLHCFKPTGLLKTMNDDLNESEEGDLVSTERVNDNNMIKIELFPNPTSDFISLTGNFVFEKAFISDITGKVVMNVEPLSVSRIDISLLNKGVYCLTVIADNKLVSGKFIKQ